MSFKLILLNSQVKKLPFYVVAKINDSTTIQQLMLIFYKQYNMLFGIQRDPEQFLKLSDTINTNNKIFYPFTFFDLKPPEFSVKSKLECFGYWNKKYKPQISNKSWSGKMLWTQIAFMIENKYREDDNHWSNFRGMAPSRLEDNVYVGSAQYSDIDEKGKNVCWPEGYIDHYIVQHNVMPTKNFYNYIIWRWVNMS